MKMQRLTKTVQIVALAVLTFILLAYARLVELGRWQLDEYAEIYKMRVAPAYFAERLRWSPRPLSEALYRSYGGAVNHFHNAFIIPLLAVLWLMLLIAALYTPLRGFVEKRASAWPMLLVTLTLIALALSSGRATEVFYWPAGAVAYLPTLAATLLLFWQIASGALTTKSGRVLVASCLSIAAASSEVGATLVLCYGSMVGTRYAMARLRRQNSTIHPAPSWIVLPLTLALAVVMAVHANRFQAHTSLGAVASSSPVMHSVKEGVKQTTIEVIGRNTLERARRAYPTRQALLRSPRALFDTLMGSELTCDLLLVVATFLLWCGAERPNLQIRRHVLEICAALMLTAVLTIVAANLQFGATCCERHELIRETWVKMILVGLALTAAGGLSLARSQRLRPVITYAPLLLLLSLLLRGAYKPLISTYKAFPALRTAAAQNSNAGYRKEVEPLFFSVLPSLGIINEEQVPIGKYERIGKIDEFSMRVYPYYLLRYYGKQTVVIRSIDNQRNGSFPRPR